jgi:hypothetical protein
MSFSSLLFLTTCVGIYQLGVFNGRNPGRLWECGQVAWKKWKNR